ncbi:MAG: VWA domain-containing protein, partial [Verrucomicrobiae bacterium]|nr:VWA domain-containing protein [Verrucomicrobiae bacterium]
MNGLTFAHPVWLWGAVLIVPLAALRLWAHLRAGGRLPGLVSPRLAHRLINGATQSRRWTIFCLQAVALLGIFAALARPQLGFEEIESETEARNLLIAIDTSRSMLSDDLPPNRLSRTRLAAKDIVLSLPDDRIGLIAFAGKPFLQAPLTVDHEAILEAIDQLDTEIIPRGGTNLSAAVNLALETVEEAKLGPSALVLFSDGEALEGLDEVENVRERAEKAGLKLLAVGVGTSGGSIIPAVNEDGEPIPGEFVKDENGQVVRTRLTPESLQALAAKGGVYFHLGGSASLTEVVSRIREHLAATREEAGTQRRPIERFLWPLSVAFGLLVLSHLAPLFWLKPVRKSASPSPARRSVAALILFLFSLVPGQLPAESVPGVAAKATEAMEATERALAEESSPRKRSFLQMQIGAQAYRAGNFEKAAEAFGSALAEGRGRYDSTALYNLGNTLFRRGETALTPRQNPDEVQSLTGNAGIETTIRDWEGAIEHFESSLALEPGNQMAAHNLDYVKQRLEELKKQQEQQNQQQEDQKEKEQQKQEDQKDQQD